MVTSQIYRGGYIGQAYAGAAGGLSTWDPNGSLKIALFTSNYTPDTSSSGDRFFSDISGDEVSGTGYTAGGETVTVDAAANPTTVGDGLFTGTGSQTITWTDADFSFQYAVIYDSESSSQGLLTVVDFGSQTANSQDIEITITGGELWTFSYV